MCSPRFSARWRDWIERDPYFNINLPRDDPSLANSDPLGAGWFFKVKLTNPAEAGALLSPDDYGKMVNQ